MTLLQDLMLTRNTPDGADFRHLAHDGATRRPNTFALTGTSRIASKYQSSEMRAKGNACWLNWAEGWLRSAGKPIVTLGWYAVSGSRTDQFSPKIALAIATGASNIVTDGPINDIARAGPATFSGSISGTTLTVSSGLSGFVGIGATVTGAGVSAGTTVVAQLSGAANGIGTYEISSSQTVAAATLTANGYIVENGPSAGQIATLANVAALALSTLKSYFKAINDAGARVVYIWERGAGNFSTAQIGALNDFNRLMADYIQNGDDYRGAPNVVVLDPTAKSIVTSNTGAIVLKNSQDAVHDTVEASKALGLDFAARLAPYLREMPGHRLRSLTHAKSGLGSRSMITNAGLSGSVAATGSGNSGNVPTNFSTGQTGGSTAAYAIQATTADPDGNTWGNEVKIVATATAAGTVSLILALDRTNIVVGDLIKGGYDIDVAAGATGLFGVQCNLEWLPATGGTAPMYDMFASTIGNDGGGYISFPMMPDPLAITTFTGQPFTNLAVRLVFGGAGNATVTVRKFWGERT